MDDLSPPNVSLPLGHPAREKSFVVSWEQFHRDARALAWRLSGHERFEGIVCVTRGGMIPAATIARELEVRVIETIGVASYHDYKNQGELQVIKQPGLRFTEDGGARYLIVDDLVDTGATAKLVRSIMPRAYYATMYAKPAGKPLVDAFITEVSQDTWIYFPWDTGLAFQEPLRGDSKG